jgi:ATP-dependent Clp protease adaptor protein ClpS
LPHISAGTGGRREASVRDLHDYLQSQHDTGTMRAMSTSVTRPRPDTKPRTERPKVYKVILLNDDYTPREFVVLVLRAVFRMTTDQAHGVMLTAHMRGSCVVAVFTREIAETKATQATDMAQGEGYPLMFTTEPED